MVKQFWIIYFLMITYYYFFLLSLGWSLLHYVAFFNRISAAKFLIEDLRIDVNIKTKARGHTALAIACSMGHLEIIKLITTIRGKKNNGNLNSKYWDSLP